MHWDALIIGAGQTGAPLAARLAESGRRVLLVERKHVGGTCANYGCTPTKTLVASARAAHVARTAERLGVRVASVEIDFAAIMDRKNALVQQWRSSVQDRLDRAGDRLTVTHGHGRFTGERSVQIDGAAHTADLIIVNTGARAAEPPIEGLADVPWLDNARIMELDRVPEHLVVVGGGFIGCEFAQMFRRFGSAVTVVESGEHLLGTEDEPVSSAIEDVFHDEGIRLHLGESVTQVARQDDVLDVSLDGGEHLSASHLASPRRETNGRQ